MKCVYDRKCSSFNGQSTGYDISRGWAREIMKCLCLKFEVSDERLWTLFLQNKIYELFSDKKIMYFYREGRGLEIPYESALKSEFSV